MKIRSKIAPCLWFDDQAEEAAKFYTGIFKNSKIGADHPLRRSRAGNPRAASPDR